MQSFIQTSLKQPEGKCQRYGFVTVGAHRKPVDCFSWDYTPKFTTTSLHFTLSMHGAVKSAVNSTGSKLNRKIQLSLDPSGPCMLPSNKVRVITNGQNPRLNTGRENTDCGGRENRLRPVLHQCLLRSPPPSPHPQPRQSD